MKEFMYDVNAVLIAAILLVSVVAAIELGFRFGLRRREAADEPAKSHVNATQGSTLGLLALLFAFTFSLSLQRFDSRSDAVVDEANAIGTAYLRTQLLPGAARSEVQARLRSYLDLRIESSSLSMAQEKEWHALQAQVGAAQNAIWADAVRATEADPNAATSGLFVQAVNELIDSFGRRDAAVNRHVPEVVLLLLYGTFLVTSAIVGYASGLGGRRPSLVSYLMVAMMILLVYVILDLDRPRRGLIEVSQKSLVDLQASIRVPSPPGK